MINEGKIVYDKKTTDIQRVGEIYQEIFGRLDEWIVDTDMYTHMDEDELYAVFSDLRYAELLRQHEENIWKSKPVITQESRVLEIVKEVRGDGFEVNAEYYSKMTEDEIKQQLPDPQRHQEALPKFQKVFSNNQDNLDQDPVAP